MCRWGQHCPVQELVAPNHSVTPDLLIVVNYLKKIMVFESTGLFRKDTVYSANR
jgi:hypothetical protein